MGRYYTGDIEGKFWFGVQSSDDAESFGGSKSEPGYVEYFFDENDKPEIEEGIRACEDALGPNLAKLDAFFGGDGKGGYTDGQLAEYLGIPPDEGARFGVNYGVNDVLRWYARLELGRKILKCVNEKGECRFEAEL